LALRRDGRLVLARERIELLAAVGDHGAIAPAARALGVSYRTAWDAVDALNNLSPSPVVSAQSGGRAGGGATLTQEGRRLVEAFRALEARLGGVGDHLLNVMAGLEAPELWTLGLRFSARNVFIGDVVDVHVEGVDALVRLAVAQERIIAAAVTREAVEALALAPGRRALALVKAGAVRLCGAEPGASARALNSLEARIVFLEEAGARCEVRLDLGGGKTLVALTEQAQLRRFGLFPGETALAEFAPGDVMLAVG
jgi:molybdate transport system regulatory protein